MTIEYLFNVVEVSRRNTDTVRTVPSRLTNYSDIRLIDVYIDVIDVGIRLLDPGLTKWTSLYSLFKLV